MRTNVSLGHLGLMLGLLAMLILLDRLIYATDYTLYNPGMFAFAFLIWTVGAALVVAEAYAERIAG